MKAALSVKIHKGKAYAERIVRCSVEADKLRAEGWQVKAHGSDFLKMERPLSSVPFFMGGKRG